MPSCPLLQHPSIHVSDSEAWSDDYDDLKKRQTKREEHKRSSAVAATRVDSEPDSNSHAWLNRLQ